MVVSDGGGLVVVLAVGSDFGEEGGVFLVGVFKGDGVVVEVVDLTEEVVLIAEEEGVGFIVGHMV